MIVIAGRIVVDPTKQDAAIPAAREMMEETLKEAGCAAYKFSADLTESGVFHIFEEWDSQEALDAHFASPHMAKFRSTVGALGAPKILKLQRSSVGFSKPNVLFLTAIESRISREQR